MTIQQRLPLVSIRRVALHKIIEKAIDEKCASIDPDKELLDVDEEILMMLLKRIITAAGRQTKSFSLEVAYSDQGTFFDLCEPIKGQSDEEFLATSCTLAQKLASAQKHNRVPGGYFILLDCSDPVTHLGQYIVIKAELDEVINVTRENDVSKLEVLDRVIFGSSKKLCKIGMLFEKQYALGPTPNERFDCLLFDEQFTDEKRPAEYFYGDFLGFSTDRNGKIQTKQFNEVARTFGLEYIHDERQRQNWLEAVRVELNSQDNLIDPTSFGRKYLPNQELQDQYLAEVTSQLPQAIPKDTTLIARRLQQHTVDFPSKIKLTGPWEDFHHKVEMILPGESLEEFLKAEEGRSYTYFRVEGSPNSRKKG